MGTRLLTTELKAQDQIFLQFLTMTDNKNLPTTSTLGKTRSMTNSNNMAVIKEKMSTFVGEKTNALTDISQATAKMLMTHYDIQDTNIINATWLSLVDPENYNRKRDFIKSFDSTAKCALKDLQPFKMLFTEKNGNKMFTTENLAALFSNLEKLNTVSNTVLQSLILMAAITLSRKKPEGLKMKIPTSVLTQSLNKNEIRKRLSFLLTLSQVLYHKSKTFDQLEQKKITKMHKDLIKIVDEF